MSTPVKPWESGYAPQARGLHSNAPPNMMQTPVGRYRNNITTQIPTPAIPLRPTSVTQQMANSYGMLNRPSMFNSFSNFGTSYGGYGSGLMGGYGGYGMPATGYGAYGGTFGGYGAGAESRFIQLAEESTRPAFQSIESLIRAFGSISMMLDSTFFAITSSFRAVLGIAENFGQLRTMFGRFWSSFAIIRALNWIYKKLLAMLGFKVASDVGTQAWNQAIHETAVEGTANGASWPIFVFLGIIVSAPYLISKLIPPVIDPRCPKNWPEKVARAQVAYKFIASNSRELSVNPGEVIKLAPMYVQDEMQLGNSGWVFAASSRGQTGIVPLNYIQPIQNRTAPPESKEIPINPPPHNQAEEQVENI